MALPNIQEPPRLADVVYRQKEYSLLDRKREEHLHMIMRYSIIYLVALVLKKNLCYPVAIENIGDQ